MKSRKTIFGINNSKIYFFGKITSLEECLILINSVFWFSMVMGVLLVLAGFLVLYLSVMDINIVIALIEGIMLLLLATVILKKRSRLASITLFIVSIVGFINALISPLGRYRGGTNFILAILLIVVALHAIRATFAYHRLKTR